MARQHWMRAIFRERATPMRRHLLLAPGDPNLYFALGKIARAEKMPGRAIKYFDDAIRLRPQEPDRRAPKRASR